MNEVILRVLTLNCWGLPQPYPIGSKDRQRRIQAIAEELASDKYDLVALQEIWSETDYRDIRVAVKSVLPYGHYFHSGFTGSGVCVFSRERIEDSLMHRYSLNGFAHHVHRGDWFGGKVIGMVRVSFKKFAVNFYTTHIHAEYDRVNDLYLAHRVVQSFEMSQFVKTTSRSADIVVVTGDLNLEPEDLGYRLIISNAGLKDAWVIRENQKSEDFDFGYTCDRPSNSYSKEATLSRWPLGKRIDYILFHAGQCVQREKDGETEALQPLLEKSVVVVSEAQRRVSSDRRFFYLALFGLSVVLLYTLNMEISVAGLTVVAMGLRFMVTIIIAFCLWYGLVGLTLEEKALKAAKAGMMKLLGKDPLDDFLQAV